METYGNGDSSLAGRSVLREVDWVGEALVLEELLLVPGSRVLPFAVFKNSHLRLVWVHARYSKSAARRPRARRERKQGAEPATACWLKRICE
jgi:hypothetical protein